MKDLNSVSCLSSPQVRQTSVHPYWTPISRQDSYPCNSLLHRPSMMWCQYTLHPVEPYLDDTRAPLPHPPPPLCALQFPNLENLTLKYLWGEPIATEIPVPPMVAHLPRLRGHLRCVGLRPVKGPVWPINLTFDPPNGTNIRSIEFQDVHWERGQQILDRCAGSLEEFAACIDRDESESLSR